MTVAAPVVAAEGPAEPSLTSLGALVDAGLPDGLGVSFVWRPFSLLRVQAGALTNTASAGVRGAVTFVPFTWYVAPSLTLEGGHLAEGDINGLVLDALSGPKVPKYGFTRMSYDFYGAQVGLEVGLPNRILLLVQGGLSRVNASLGTSTQSVATASGTARLDAGTIKIGATLPSAKIGLLVFLY